MLITKMHIVIYCKDAILSLIFYSFNHKFHSFTAIYRFYSYFRMVQLENSEYLICKTLTTIVKYCKVKYK